MGRPVERVDACCFLMPFQGVPTYASFESNARGERGGPMTRRNIVGGVVELSGGGREGVAEIPKPFYVVAE